MKALIQRVKRASVEAAGEKREIGEGLVVLAAISKDDSEKNVKSVAAKTVSLRIFPDGNGKFNFSVKDTGGEILVVSQFTLYGDCSRGNRPGFEKSAGKEKAAPYFDMYLNCLKESGLNVKNGFFGQEMVVEIINDGPVTLMIEN